MDARLRLNRLRRTNHKSGRVSDLRQLIASKDNKINKLKDNRNSVKNRIGFKTKNYRLNNNNNSLQGNALNESKTRRQTTTWNKNKRVSISDDKGIPKVVVDLTKINSQSTNTSKVSNKYQWKSPTVTARQTSTGEQKNTVIVSNLNKTITENDIKELFGGIGPLVSAAKINISVAVVEYRNAVDARNACQTYHNRLLDGMPMQCNILYHPSEGYVIESQPKRQPRSESTSYSTLLAAQLRQINEIPLQTNTNIYSKRFN